MVDNHDRSALARELEEAMEGRSFPTLAAAQAFADEFMRKRNARGLDAFLGLSPDEMHHLLYKPFETPDRIVLQRQIDLQLALSSPMLSLFLMLVEGIGDKGVKATAKGNLPRALCRELAAAHRERFPYPDRYWVDAISTETDAPDLHAVRVVGQLAGLIRRYKGRIIVSQKCRKLIRRNDGHGLYFALFDCYTRKFNWAYRDGFPDLPFVQHSFMMTLYMLARHGDEARATDFYVDAYLRAFPMVLDQIPEARMGGRGAGDKFRALYTWRCLRQFVVFTGLGELAFERNPEGSGFERYRVSIRATPLLNALVQFRFGAPYAVD
ncbi:MAG: hypothetical protein WCY98_02755 [Castellaniella sp.]